MINLGRPQVKVLSDGWTAVTRDRSLSAQFEHSVGVTETGSRSSPSRPRASTSRRTEPERERPARRLQSAASASILTDVAVRVGACRQARQATRRPGASEEPPTISAIASACASASSTPARSLSDYELLELLLFTRIPRRDTKPLAKALIAKFGSFTEVLRPRRRGSRRSRASATPPSPSSRSCRPPPPAGARSRSRSGRCCHPGRR